MLVNSNQILNKAYQEKYAVCQFNINNLEWTKYILETCNENKAPVILGVSLNAVKYMGGFLTVVKMVEGLIKDLEIKIPVIIHLDHGSSFDDCKNAIDAGFTSVMIDGSGYPIEENIKITKMVVDYANGKVSVEAEIGHIGGEEDDVVSSVFYAKVEDAIKLVTESKINSLAPAIGNVHGLYKGEPKLDFELLNKINQAVTIPLVLHGGSGILDHQIEEAISLGICKININTELQMGWTKAVRNFLNENQKINDPRKIIKSGESAIKKIVFDKLKLANSINQA